MDLGNLRISGRHPERGRRRVVAAPWGGDSDVLAVDRWAHAVLGCDPTRDELAPLVRPGGPAFARSYYDLLVEGLVPDDGRVVYGIGKHGPRLVHDSQLRYGGSPGPDRPREHPERGRRLAVGTVDEPTGAGWLDRRLFRVRSWADVPLGCEPTLAGMGPFLGSRRLGVAKAYFHRLEREEVPDDGRVVYGLWDDGTPGLVHESELRYPGYPDPRLAARLSELARDVERSPLLPAQERAATDIPNLRPAAPDDDDLTALTDGGWPPGEQAGALAALYDRLANRRPDVPCWMLRRGRTPALSGCRCVRVQLLAPIALAMPDGLSPGRRETRFTTLVAVVATVGAPVVWALDWHAPDGTGALGDVLFRAARRRHYAIVDRKRREIAAGLRRA